MKAITRWIVLGVVSLALLMLMIDITVLYTVIPSLSDALRLSAAERLWIINTYALVVAGLLPLCGQLSDKFGPRPLLMVGLAVFGLASLAAAFSPSAWVLISSRAALAVGAALMMPATLSVVRILFDDPKERAIAIGVWTAVAGGGAAFGPIAGGLLLEHFWWGAVFLVNVPMVLLALPLTSWLMPKVGGDVSITIDLKSAIQAMVGLVASIAFIKNLFSSDPHPLKLLLLGVVGALFLFYFVTRQRQLSRPMIDFGLLRDPLICWGVVAAIAAYVVVIGVEFAVSQRLQLVQGLSPLDAGMALLPIFLAMMFCGPLAALLTNRLGVLNTIGAAFIFAALGVLAAAAFSTSMPATLVALAVIGAGEAIGATAASIAIIQNVAKSKAGMAASIEQVSYELGGTLGFALLGGLLGGLYSLRLVLPEAENATAGAMDTFEGTRALAATLSPELQTATLEAAVGAFDSAFITMMVTAAGIWIVLGCACLAWSRRNQRI